MKMMHGQFCLACSNRSRTRLAPTPTNISTKSEPEIEKNGTPASPATARASSVLPVPGGPNSSTPLGMRAPSAWNFFGFSRNSLISCSSSTASSTPATSLNVILGESTDIRLARLLPKLMTLLPPPCIWFIRKIQKAKNSTKGRIVTRMLHHGEPEVTEPSTTTFALLASAAEIAWSISEVLGMPIVTVWLPSDLVTLYLRLLSPRLVFRYWTLPDVGGLGELVPGVRLLAAGVVDDHLLGEKRQHDDHDDRESCALEKPAHGLLRLPAWGTDLNDITEVFRLIGA